MNDAPKRLLTAAFVAPMDGPVLRDAGVVIDGDAIAAVGLARQLRLDHSDAAVEDLGDVVVMPGLINAHTHLELSLFQPGPQPRSFTDWLIATMSSPLHSGGDATARAIAEGLKQCRRFGVTSVGDISVNPTATRALLGDAIGGVQYGEVRAMAQRRGLLDARVTAATTPTRSPTVRAGISPHAPYSIEAEGYARCLATAKQFGLPITTHLAESADEARFLADHDGPFLELWRHLDAWDDAVPRFPGGPIRFAKALGLIDHPTSLAHVNYCDDDELAILAAGRASVVYCPRTHAYFGHAPHRWRDMLAAGINVAVGTDSCASSPDLNVVDELRLLHRRTPDVHVLELWQMATTRAAIALELGHRIGSITAGKRADLVAFASNDDEPLRDILRSDQEPIAAWVNGRRVAQ